MYTCPKGCQSTDSDYCSECGAKMTNASAPPPPPAQPTGPYVHVNPSASSANVCPDCTAPRVPPNALFCEICRYDFHSGTSSQIVAHQPQPKPQTPPPPADPNPPLAVAIAPASPSTPPPPVVQPAPCLTRLEALVSVDRAIFKPVPPIASADEIPDRTFALDLSDMLIGRRSDVKDIHPEIPLNDDAAVSHRHAKLLRQPDGSYCLLDLSSANGTQLNGADLTPGVRTPIKSGDVIRVGRWTMLSIRAMNAEYDPKTCDTQKVAVIQKGTA